MLYPQVEGIDDGRTQNPEGCWDWWGYSCPDADAPDYYSQNAIQIRAIHAMLQRLGAPPERPRGETPMRTRKASMMAPTRAASDALPQALLRMAKASLYDPAHPRPRG